MNALPSDKTEIIEIFKSMISRTGMGIPCITALIFCSWLRGIAPAAKLAQKIKAGISILQNKKARPGKTGAGMSKNSAKVLMLQTGKWRKEIFMSWIKWHTESAAYPKFRVIAKNARVKIGEALAVWLIMLEYGYTHGGTISGLDPEIIEATLALKLEKVEAVIDVMREKGMLGGDRISKWEERQAIPAFGESSKIPLVKMTSTERSRAYRAQKGECNAETVAYNANGTPL